MVSIEILQAVPAAGKTKAILNHVLKNKKKCVIASISCQLSRQSYDYYKNLGGKNCIIIDTEHISRSSSVSEHITNSINNFRVIFITHAALLRYPDFSNLKNYELYIDEVPEFVELNQLKFTDNMNILSKYCNISDSGMMTLVEDNRTSVEKIATDGLYNHDVVSASIFKLARAVLQGVPVAIRDNIAYFIDDTTTQNWKSFDKITIACANFKETFTGVILKEYCGWKFIESPLKDKLDFIKYPNTERVEIIPLFDGTWSRYIADKEIDGISVYNQVKDLVYELTGMISFIYTTNSYRSALRTGERVAYNPHGLNNYMSHTTAAALFSYNPMPWQLSMLRNLSEYKSLDETRLSEAYLVSKYLEPVFQLCLRTDIRNKNSLSKIRLIVPDMRAADYLKSRYLHNASIDDTHMIKLTRKKTERKKRKQEDKPRRITSMIGLYKMNSSEKGKYNRWIKKMEFVPDILNQKDLLIVKEWIESIRSQSL